MQAGQHRNIRMQVLCPLCNTRLVFEVAAQYAGRTVRVTCTGCDTPIDASTEMPGSAPPMPQAVQDRMQLSNDLANRMQKSPQPSPSNDLRQQQQQQQRGQQGAAKGAETLKYEVQCPHPEVSILVYHLGRSQAWRSLSGIIFLASSSSFLRLHVMMGSVRKRLAATSRRLNWASCEYSAPSKFSLFPFRSPLHHDSECLIRSKKATA